MYHLGQAPGTQGGQHNHTEQVDGIRAEQGVEGAGLGTVGVNILQTLQRRRKSTLVMNHTVYHCRNTRKHDKTLYKVIDGRCGIAAQNHVYCCKQCHGHNNHHIRGVRGQIKRHSKQAGQTVVYGRGIGNQENKHDCRSSDFQTLGLKPIFKKLRHGLGAQMLGHDTGTASQHHPGQQAADYRISHTNPGGGYTIVPTELTGIADEYNGREIRSAVCKSCQPGTGCSAPQNKITDGFGFPAGVEPDAQHDENVDDNHSDCT